ncbi:hypothetical protein [Streptomyces sp. NPDC026673]|uniref:hypothetical protein n=1 Tax=Streptomyces sp. NPDC026673 TaxID=3155724 RepID=UPI0034104C5E
MALPKKLAAGTIAALATGALVLGGTGTALADDACHEGDWSQCLQDGTGWSAAELQEALQSFLEAHPDIAADPHVQSLVTLVTEWWEAHPGMTHDRLMDMLDSMVSCLEAGGGFESCAASPS